MKGNLTKQKILENGVAMASVEGLGGVTIGNLAKMVGLSKSGLYGHFNSKENLQLAILQNAIDRFIEQVVLPALKTPRGEPRVRALFERWLTWDHSEFMPGGCLFVDAAVELADQPGPLRDLLVQAQQDWLDTLSSAARIAIDEGHFREDLDTDELAHNVYSAAYGYHFISRLLRDRDAKRHALNLVETLLADARRR